MFLPELLHGLPSGGVSGPDSSHLDFGKDDAAVPLASRDSAMPTCVGDILRGGAPTEIFKPVVRRIAVEVAAFHPLWARADESFKDKAVNKSQHMSGMKADLNVPVSVHSLRLQETPGCAQYRASAAPAAEPLLSPAAPDAAVVADAVAREVKNATVFNSHGMHLQPRCVLRSGQPAAHEAAGCPPHSSNLYPRNEVSCGNDGRD